jgi:hypothetical protein
VALLACTAAITKEPAAAFVAALVLIAYYSRRLGLRPAHLAAGAGGAAAGLLLNGAFNLFRYGTPVNLDYLRPGLEMPLQLRPQYVLAQVVSPTFGMLWFWPAAVGLLALCTWLALRGGSRLRRPMREPAVWVLVLAGLLLVGFASWHAPFGSSVWGSRLLLPWMPALTLLAVAIYGPECEAFLARASRRVVIAGGIAVLALALPHLGVLVDSSSREHRWPGVAADLAEVAYQPFVPTPACPVFPDPIDTSEDYYYRCLHASTWDMGFALTRGYGPLSHGARALWGLGLAAAVFSLLSLGFPAMRSGRTAPAAD